jgi:hypothetical protein
MESEVIYQLTILMIRLLIMSYDGSETKQQDYLFFLEDEKIVLTGDFKNVEKIVLCDDELYNKCSFHNEQRIILHGQTQILLEISIYPWSYGDMVWYHAVPSSNKKGYRFFIGQIYDKVTPIDKGGY